jgi:hypothetical protein
LQLRGGLGLPVQGDQDAGRGRLVEVPRLAAGQGLEELQPNRPGRRVPLGRDLAAQRPGEPLGVGHPGASASLGDLGGEPLGLLEAAPQDGQHGLAGGGRDRPRRVAGGGRLPLEDRQGRLGLSDPAELHQRHEPPEQGATLPGTVPRRPSEFDDLGRGGQPVGGTGRVPQRVQAPVEHLGHGLWVPPRGGPAAAPGRPAGGGAARPKRRRAARRPAGPAPARRCRRRRPDRRRPLAGGPGPHPDRGTPRLTVRAGRGG